MGIDVFLCWEENGNEKWKNIMKLSCYSWDLMNPFVRNLKDTNDVSALLELREWVKAMSYLLRNWPAIFTNLKGSNNTLVQYEEWLGYDLKQIEGAIERSDGFRLSKTRCWVDVG